MMGFWDARPTGDAVLTMEVLNRAYKTILEEGVQPSMCAQTDTHGPFHPDVLNHKGTALCPTCGALCDFSKPNLGFPE